MGERGSLYQPSDDESGLGIGPSFYSAPLLPFERQLIDSINITEDEYRYFIGEAIRRSKTRPAEYDHIPDVQNGPVAAVFISIAVSLVVTGVSMLLTPKPKMPKAQRRDDASILNQKLDSLSAGRRFVPSKGFDTLAELADYNSPIPIIFGLYNDNSGGMLVTPKLVWSRMYSLGTEQAALLMFVVGEEGSSDEIKPDGLEKPALPGLFLGNNALDVLYSDLFQVYWKQNTTSSETDRILGKNSIHGTCPLPDRGKLGDEDDVFLCPTHTLNDKGFCHSYSPANNTKFGCYAPIANGTTYRLNFMPISIPENTPDDGDINPIIRRIKIAGDGDRGKLFKNRNLNNDDYLKKARDLYMGNGPDGIPKDLENKRIAENIGGEEFNGRNYSARMGVSKYNGVEFKNDENKKRIKVQTVSVGDTIEFVISDSAVAKDFYKRSRDNRGEEVDEINNGVKTLCREADEVMQVGQIFAIGCTVWQVTNRLIEKFDINDGTPEDQVITLQCIDTSDSLRSEIGLVDRTKVIHPDNYVSDGNPVGEAFFPLTRYAKAVIRNNRPADATEFGIKSRVFQRLNNIGNFMSFPLPNKLESLDDDNVNLQGGTISRSIARTSCFTVFVRKAGVKEDDQTEFPYVRLDPIFAVTGSSPIDQYHSIRFTHPNDGTPTEYEYKFVPLPGSEVRSLEDGKIKLIQLTAAATQQNKVVTFEADTEEYGKFTITTAGDSEVSIEFLKQNLEFTTGGQITGGKTERSNTPTIVETVEYLPVEELPAEERATSGRLYPPNGEWRIANDAWELAGLRGKDGAFTWDVMTSPDVLGDKGKPDVAPFRGPYDVRQKEYFTVPGKPNARRWILFEYSLLKFTLPDDRFPREAPLNPTESVWHFHFDESLGIVGRKIIKSMGDFSRGEVLEIKRGLGATNNVNLNSPPYPDDNPFTRTQGKKLTFSGFRFQIQNTESYTGHAGREQGYLFEIFGHAEDRSEGSKVSEDRKIDLGAGRILTLTLTSTVIKMPENHWSAEKRAYTLPTVAINRSLTTGNYAVDEIIDDLVTLSLDNPFIRASNTKFGCRYKVSGLEQSVSPTITGAQRNFAQQTQISDISFYRDFVEKSNQHEPEHEIIYVNEYTRNDSVPAYPKMTIAGLLIKASRNFTKLDQLRTWLPKGIHVMRLHPDLTTYEDDTDSHTYNTDHGPSNLLTDLIYFLLTDSVTGAGNLLKMKEDNPVLIDVDDFKNTSKFLKTNKLFYNGAITNRANIRDIISDLAPNFLCNFIISNGKFSLVPALPTTAAGEIDKDSSITSAHMFTEGNIIEDTFQLEYLNAEERASFRASVRYREERRNKLPVERVIDLKLRSESELPIETFDLTDFCTTRHHAEMVGRYFITLRKLVTHTIKFSTTVNGINLKAGDFITVKTRSTPYHLANVGTVSPEGLVQATTPLKDGIYQVIYYNVDAEGEYQDGEMEVSNNQVTDDAFNNSVFTIIVDTNSRGIYMVEQLTFSQEGTVDIVASEYPCDDKDRSILARDVLDPNLYDVIPIIDP